MKSRDKSVQKGALGEYALGELTIVWDHWG
jgi:hypothetical protein